MFAIVIIGPLLYIPGWLIVGALLGPRQTTDALERHYERVIAGTLLNGWLAFTLAELGLFSAWLHLVLLAVVCGGALLLARRRGVKLWDAGPLGIIANGRRTKDEGRRTNTHHQSSIVNRQSSIIAHWDMLALAAIGVLFVALAAPPFETVLGGRDAGVYANTGFAIARTGSIVQFDPLVAQIGQDQQAADPALRAAAEQAKTNFLGPQPATRFIATRLRAAGFLIYGGDLAAGRIVPQGLHLFPVWIGLLASMLGFQGGLLATGLMGWLGVWSVGMLGRRLAGPWVGVLAATLLALNGVQVWFSRYSTAETTMQFLTFAGLYAFAVMATNDERRPMNDHNDDSILNSQFSILNRDSFAALLAGIAFGQLALARIDFILVVAPLLAYLLYVWLTQRWTRRETLLSAGLFAMLLHAAIHIATIARAYFFDTLYARLQDYAVPALLSLPFLTPELREVYLTRPCSPLTILRLPAAPGTPSCPPFKDMPPTEFVGWNYGRIAAEVALVTLLIVAVLLLRPQIGRVLRHAERLVTRWSRPLLGLAAAGILLLGTYGYLARPQILSAAVLRGLPGCLTPAQLSAPAGACLALQGYVGAPIALPPGREVYTIPLANLVRVGWYLSPLGIVLAVAGFAWWWRRGLNRASWLFLLVGLITTVFFVRQTYGTDEQSYIYILRRFVPQVYPVLCLSMAYALAWLGRWTMDDGRWKDGRAVSFVIRHSSFVASALLTLALIAFLLLTNRPIYRHVEYGGALEQLAAIAKRFGPDDVVLFRTGSRDLPDTITTPLTYAFGLNAITIKSSAPGKYADSLATYIRHWQAQGRNVYLVMGPSGAVGLPGFAQQPTGTLALNDLHEFEQLTNQKPRNVSILNLPFAVYQLTPNSNQTPPTALGPRDFGAQVRGFYQPELIADASVAWTDGAALLRLPWPTGPLTLTVQLAGGVRPAELGPAQACLSFAPETTFWYEGQTPPLTFTEPHCVTLEEQLRGYTVPFDLRGVVAPPTGTLLLRITSATWVPAKYPGQNDRRSLGVQFGGVGREQVSR